MNYDRAMRLCLGAGLTWSESDAIARDVAGAS